MCSSSPAAVIDASTELAEKECTMTQEQPSPFESIESAHDFVNLLSETVSQTRKDIDADLARQESTSTRSLDALRIASYNLEKLETYMKRSGRILNDLRTLRRLLFQERKTATRTPAAKAEAASVNKPAPAGSARRSDSKTGAVAVL
jgi:hypothetical protein